MNEVFKTLHQIISFMCFLVVILFFIAEVVINPNIVTVTITLAVTYICISQFLIHKKPTILFAKTRPNARIPSREQGNAGFDIYGVIPNGDQHCIILKPHETKLIPTGIASVIPDGYYIQIHERGSTGSKGIKYSAGVMDSSYRGEWFLATTNTNDKPVIFYDEHWEENADKPEYKDCILYPLSKAIFQGVIHSTHDYVGTKSVMRYEINRHKTKRGDGMLGSSGK